MPTDAETLKWVTVDDFSPGIYGPRGTVLNSQGRNQLGQQAGGAPLGAAQLLHAAVDGNLPVTTFADSSGHGYHAEIRSADIPGILYHQPGFVTGDTGVGVPSTLGFYAGRYTFSVPPPFLDAGDVWACQWVGPSYVGGGGSYTNANPLFIHINGNGGFSIGSNFSFNGALMGIRVSRAWGVIFGQSDSLDSAQVAVTPGASHFIAVTYQSSTDTFRFYLDGVLIDTQTGSGHNVTTVQLQDVNIAPSDNFNVTVFDEIAFGAGLPSGAQITALYAARGNFATYSALVLALNPIAYYHLNETAITPRVTYPGTYKCVCEPGKGLIGGPRRIAEVVQNFPIVAGTTNTDVANNTMVDSSGNGHHGHYNLAELTRIVGAFSDDGGISSLNGNSLLAALNGGPVAVGSLGSDFTINVWVDQLNGTPATIFNLFKAVSASTGSSLQLDYSNDQALNQFKMILTLIPNGGAPKVYTSAVGVALLSGYRMITVTYNHLTDTAKFYVNSTLLSTIVGAGYIPSIYGADAVITTAFKGGIGYRFDELSIHPSLLSGANIATIYAAIGTHAAYKAAILTFAPDSYYAMSEDGTHAIGENRALITASHLVSPVVRGSAALPVTMPIAPAYQDGLFVSFSQFVDPLGTTISNMSNRVDCRFYKLWRNPNEHFSLSEAYAGGVPELTVATRLDGSPWTSPFWHGVADFAEIVNSVTNDGNKPFMRQVTWLYNMIQSQLSGPTYAFLITGFPKASTHTVDSIESLATKSLGVVFFSPELIFSHEGRLCAIDGYDGDAFGTSAAGRGMNDIAYFTIRGALLSGLQIFGLQRPIEENQSGIRVAQSVNANELFLVKATGGGAVISGDMDFPTIRRLPGLHSPGDIYAKPINTPLGIVYAGHGGVFLWSGAETSQLLSPQFDGPFWNPYLGPLSAYTPAANRFGFQGGFGWLYPWLLSPSHFMWDSRFQSWWLLDVPNNPYPSLFMHGTGQGHILAVYPEINANFNIVASRYDSELQERGYSWTSQPITPEAFHVAVIREVNIQASVDALAGDALITVTVAGIGDSNYEEHTVQLIGDSRPHTYRMTFAVETETFIISLGATGAQEVGNLNAPKIHSFRVGYELTAQHPEAVETF